MILHRHFLHQFLFLFLILPLGSCGNSSSTTNAKEQISTGTNAVEGPTYPSITQEEMIDLFNRCDYIDYIFYNYSFSISQGEKPAIQAALNHVSKTIAKNDPSCKPIGRIFYQIEGENVLEADIFFAQGCKYYLFYKDQKPVYANELSPAGVNFYNNVFQGFEKYKSNK